MLDWRENKIQRVGHAHEPRWDALLSFSLTSVDIMCPGRVLFSLTPPTEHITLLQPKAMANGGIVLPSDVNIPSHVVAEDDPDRVLVRLMPGELVIPTKHVKRVVKYLKSQKISLPRM